jgi:hypothetical protein
MALSSPEVEPGLAERPPDAFGRETPESGGTPQCPLPRARGVVVDAPPCFGLLRLLGLWAGEEDDFPLADEHNRAGKN